MVDNELILQQFEEIEKRVKRLVAGYQSLKEANSKFQIKIKKLEGELKTRTETENRNRAIKGKIKSKIENLLVKLEDVTEV